MKNFAVLSGLLLAASLTLLHPSPAAAQEPYNGRPNYAGGFQEPYANYGRGYWRDRPAIRRDYWRERRNYAFYGDCAPAAFPPPPPPQQFSRPQLPPMSLRFQWYGR